MGSLIALAFSAGGAVRGKSGGDLMDRLDRRLAHRRLTFHASLRAELSAAALRGFAGAVDREMPGAFREFLRWRNGQGSDTAESFLHSWTVLSADEIERDRQLMLANKGK